LISKIIVGALILFFILPFVIVDEKDEVDSRKYTPRVKSEIKFKKMPKQRAAPKRKVLLHRDRSMDEKGSFSVEKRKTLTAESRTPSQPIAPIMKAYREFKKYGKKDTSTFYYLHIFSFRDRKNAERKIQNLYKHGYKTFFLAEKVSGEKWFRVYLGEFADEEEARKVGSKLMGKGIISYYRPVTRRNHMPSSHDAQNRDH